MRSCWQYEVLQTLMAHMILQGLEPEEEEDPDAYLMECWPDDPADIGLESVLKTIGPLFEQRLYQARPLTCPQLIVQFGAQNSTIYWHGSQNLSKGIITSLQGFAS